MLEKDHVNKLWIFSFRIKSKKLLFGKWRNFIEDTGETKLYLKTFPYITLILLFSENISFFHSLIICNDCTQVYKNT